MMDNSHSPLGASGAKRWLACSGSFQLARALAATGELDDNSSEYADLGHAAHEVAALCLTKGLEPYQTIGLEFGAYTAGVEIELDAVSVYTADCESLRANADMHWIEQRFALPDLHPLMRGTMDFAAYKRGQWLRLRDYKHGAGVPVDAEENEQLLYYAFMTIIGLEIDKNEPDNFLVEIGIVQPRCWSGQEVKTWETTLGDVLAFGYQVLLPRMRELQPVSESMAEFVLGDHCQFCPVLLDCPASQDAFLAFSEEPDVEMLNDAQLSAYYEKKDAARRFMNALEAKVKGRLMDRDNKITTAKLVAPKTDRVWIPDAPRKLRARLGERAYNPPTLKSPTQIEALGAEGKALAKELAYKPTSNGFSVAPISDKRDAIRPSTPAETFAAYAEPSKPTYEGF